MTIVRNRCVVHDQMGGWLQEGPAYRCDSCVDSRRDSESTVAFRLLLSMCLLQPSGAQASSHETKWSFQGLESNFTKCMVVVWVNRIWRMNCYYINIFLNVLRSL